MDNGLYKAYATLISVSFSSNITYFFILLISVVKYFTDILKSNSYMLHLHALNKRE